MSISTDQKLDYLWKKVGYGAAKRDINSVLNATQEGVPSPLLLRGDNVWAQSGDIPGVMPAQSGGVVTVYPTTSPIEVSSFDASARNNRFWNTGQIDWIPPELGSTYFVKVYIHTSGDAANAAANGTQVFATGSGNNDEWFFDYQAGTLNFIGDNLPNGVNFTGKSVYISGARYTGTKGVSIVGAAGSFSDLFVTGISTFEGNVNVGTSITMYSQTGIISATFYGDGSNLTGVGTGAQVSRVCKVSKDTRVSKDSKATREFKVFKVYKVFKDNRVSKDSKVTRVSKVYKVSKVIRVLKVFRVVKVRKQRRVLKVSKALKDAKERKVLRDFRVLKVTKALKERKVPKVVKVSRVFRVTKDFRVSKETKVYKV